MRNFGSSPLEMISSLVNNRRLILTLIKREILGRYKGSVLGLLWSFFNPVFMLAIYTFIFSVVFKARWSGGSESKVEFALLLFAGLIAFNLFAECFNRAPNLVISNVNYVKKVVFPLEILPVVVIGASCFHAIINIFVWIFFYIIAIGFPNITILFLPFVLIPLVLFLLGLTWGLASLGVYLRDVGQIVGVLTSVLMFMSPIFYPITALPETVRPILGLNPLAPAISQMRDIMYWGVLPDVKNYLIYLIICSFVSIIGFFWFQKTRKGFADVI